MSAPEQGVSDASILPLELRGVGLDSGGVRALEDVSLRLEARGISALLGPNGAGKSSLLRLVAGLLVPSRGTLHWREADVARVRARCALVLQRPVLLRRSVSANLAYPLALRGMPRAQRTARVAEVLAALRLEALAARPARLLSAGEQQRIALARAFATRPELLLLDEPGAALDPASARAVESAIAAIAAAGTTVVLATHDLAQAKRLASSVLFLERGRLLEHTSAVEFFASPRSEPARRFLAGELIA